MFESFSPLGPSSEYLDTGNKPLPSSLPLADELAKNTTEVAQNVLQPQPGEKKPKKKSVIYRNPKKAGRNRSNSLSSQPEGLPLKREDLQKLKTQMEAQKLTKPHKSETSSPPSSTSLPPSEIRTSYPPVSTNRAEIMASKNAQIWKCVNFEYNKVGAPVIGTKIEKKPEDGEKPIDGMEPKDVWRRGYVGMIYDFVPKEEYDLTKEYTTERQRQECVIRVNKKTDEIKPAFEPIPGESREKKSQEFLEIKKQILNKLGLEFSPNRIRIPDYTALKARWEEVRIEFSWLNLPDLDLIPTRGHIDNETFFKLNILHDGIQATDLEQIHDWTCHIGDYIDAKEEECLNNYKEKIRLLNFLGVTTDYIDLKTLLIQPEAFTDPQNVFNLGILKMGWDSIKERKPELNLPDFDLILKNHDNKRPFYQVLNEILENSFIESKFIVLRESGKELSFINFIPDFELPDLQALKNKWESLKTDRPDLKLPDFDLILSSDISGIKFFNDLKITEKTWDKYKDQLPIGPQANESSRIFFLMNAILDDRLTQLTNARLNMERKKFYLLIQNKIDLLNNNFENFFKGTIFQESLESLKKLQKVFVETSGAIVDMLDAPRIGDEELNINSLVEELWDEESNYYRSLTEACPNMTSEDAINAWQELTKLYKLYKLPDQIFESKIAPIIKKIRKVLRKNGNGKNAKTKQLDASKLETPQSTILKEINKCHFEEALLVTSFIPNKKIKTYICLQKMLEFMEKGREDLAVKFKDIIPNISNKNVKTDIYVQQIHACLEKGRLDIAVKYANWIPDDDKKIECLLKICDKALSNNDTKTGKAIVSIFNKDIQNDTQLDIFTDNFENFTNTSSIAQAEKIRDLMDVGSEIYNIASDTIEIFEKITDINEEIILAKSEDASARAHGNIAGANHLNAALTSILNEIQEYSIDDALFDDGLFITSFISDDEVKKDICMQQMIALAEEGRDDLGDQFADIIPNFSNKQVQIEIYKKLVLILVKKGRFDLAVKFANDIPDEGMRIENLIMICDKALDNNESTIARTIVRDNFKKDIHFDKFWDIFESITNNSMQKAIKIRNLMEAKTKMHTLADKIIKIRSEEISKTEDRFKKIADLTIETINDNLRKIEKNDKQILEVAYKTVCMHLRFQGRIIEAEELEKEANIPPQIFTFKKK